LKELADRYIDEFGSVFNRDMRQVNEDALRAELRHSLELNFG
jgi:hypothetical protein